MSKNFFFILVLVFLVVGIISFVRILNQSFVTASRNKELQNKILETQLQLRNQELHYLKQQIHPHFLFNTLNTIYGFALKQSAQTPEVILKLSNLLDYILYQVQKPKVSLNEEVLHIQEYIELEKIRFQDTLKITFYSPQIEKEIQIAPMLLIPFVENAFKHGSIIDGFLHIDIHVEFIKNELRFLIRNSFNNAEIDENNSGLGIENIKKRLELNYPSKYQLQNWIENKVYHVELKITGL